MNWGDNFGVSRSTGTDPTPISLQIRDVDGDITIQQKINLQHDPSQADEEDPHRRKNLEDL